MSTQLEGKAPKVAVAEASMDGASDMRRPSSPRGTSSELPRVVRQQGMGMWEQTKSNNLHRTQKNKIRKTTNDNAQHYQMYPKSRNGEKPGITKFLKSVTERREM
jgi:hypothetical protein